MARSESPKAASAGSGKGSVPVTQIMISPPNFGHIEINIVGTAPYVQARFSQKAQNMMMEKMAAGPTAKKGRQREARDYDADFKGAQHISDAGWVGIPAAAFRKAMIDVCRAVNFKMTHAKMSVFVEADGFDKIDGSPLVKLLAGAPERLDLPTRNANGSVDIRVRPMWRKWGAKVHIKFDADQFTGSDVANLLARAGQQIGVGEGRPFSRESAGMGYGVFVVEETKAK